MLGHSNVDIDTATGGFGDLLELLSYADGEYLSINHQPRGGNFTSRVAPYAAGLAANVLAAAEGVAADVWADGREGCPAISTHDAEQCGRVA